MSKKYKNSPYGPSLKELRERKNNKELLKKMIDKLDDLSDNN
ncbi:MAG: hypothetical protein ACQEQE_08125 [Bacillota bacterium]